MPNLDEDQSESSLHKSAYVAVRRWQGLSDEAISMLEHGDIIEAFFKTLLAWIHFHFWRHSHGVFQYSREDFLIMCYHIWLRKLQGARIAGEHRYAKFDLGLCLGT